MPPQGTTGAGGNVEEGGGGLAMEGGDRGRPWGAIAVLRRGGDGGCAVIYGAVSSEGTATPHLGTPPGFGSRRALSASRTPPRDPFSHRPSATAGSVRPRGGLTGPHWSSLAPRRAWPRVDFSPTCSPSQGGLRGSSSPEVLAFVAAPGNEVAYRCVSADAKQYVGAGFTSGVSAFNRASGSCSVPGSAGRGGTACDSPQLLMYGPKKL